MERIHFETNIYCIQKGKRGDIQKEELLVFFAINIIMGYHKLPAMKHYWIPSVDMEVKLISTSMARDHFSLILGKLHLNDNSKIEPAKKVNYFNLEWYWKDSMNCFGTRSFHYNISVLTNLQFGSSSLKQYNPMKPIKRGYKLWCIADNHRYDYKFEIYTGKNLAEENPLKKDLGLGGMVVTQLTENLKGKNHQVFFDNFFHQFHPLTEVLQANKIMACATIRSSRKDFPAMSDDKQLKRGNYDYRCTPSGILVYKWRDNPLVHLLSNFHLVVANTEERKKEDGSKFVVSCPQVVKDYSNNMGEVDKHDMLRQLYGLNSKSLKLLQDLFWSIGHEYSKYFYFIFGCASYKDSLA